VVGATSALVQGVFMGRLLQQFGELRLAILGMLSSFIITTSYGLTTQSTIFIPLDYAKFFIICG
jgi:hypothetical protein